MSDPFAPKVRRRLAETLRGGPLAPAAPVAVAALAVAFPLVSGDPYWPREIMLTAVLALVVSGLNLSFGFAGELQFGQVFAFGLGGYATMVLATHGFDEAFALVAVGGLAAAAAGAVIAVPALRIGGWPLALTSFFLVLAFPDLVAISGRYTGGLNGLVGIPDPAVLGSRQGSAGLYEITLAVTIAWFAFYRNLVTSHYGIALRTLRESPVLASSLGFSTFRLKVLAYALGAFPAGMAGCLFGFISLVLTPASFGLTLAIAILAASILGGSQSVYGAIAGAAVLQLGPQSSLSFQQYAPIAYGLFLVAAALGLRGGLSGLARDAALRLAGVLSPSAAPARPAPLGRPAGLGRLDGVPLEVTSLSMAFGGVLALEAVSLTAAPGAVTALIGSNGSGKTTLLNVICGYANAREGAVTLGRSTLTGLPAHRIARAGVARTFQTPSLPRGVCALDAVASGRYRVGRRGVLASVLRLPGARRSALADRRDARSMLDLLGLGALASVEAATLSLGERRRVEVARALCGRPRLLLLDEPAAGLSAEEAERLGTVLKTVARAGAAVVVIEHNLGFVTRTADHAHVLHLGTLIASGPAATIATHPEVVASYLGPPAAPRPRAARRRAGAGDVVLELRGAESGYDARRVLHGISLAVPAGTVEVVLGRNGVGKTTLLHTIAGAVALRAGTLELSGVDVGRRSASRRAAAGVALVQEGKRVFRERTVLENLALGTFTRPLSRRERAQECAAVLGHFPALQARSGDPAGSLSGGQQQMLAIAQALVARPGLLLLDEPSSGLARSIVSEVFGLARRLSDDGMAIVLVEQLADEALAIADHVTVLDGGRVVSAGVPEKFGDRRELQDAYFGGVG